uniref:Uncharacterized protein n=1 Tax=Arundo donax TaxID=35708 RepID=A0A0A9GDI9_ARUDO
MHLLLFSPSLHPSPH